MAQSTPLVQTMQFGRLEIAFDERILVPRPWTLRQSEWAERLLLSAPDGDVLELCSGAGHIGLHAVLASDRRLVMVDIDPVACQYARHNAAAAAMADRVEVRDRAIDQALQPDETFALVIADPPWVETAGTSVFPDDPLLAIDGGADGLDIGRLCAATADAHLLAGGSLLIQLGSLEQAETLCGETGFELGAVQVEPGRGVVAHLVKSPG